MLSSTALRLSLVSPRSASPTPCLPQAPYARPEGRFFTAEGRGNAPLVTIVSQSMAKHSWPGQNALGKRIHIGNPKKGLPWATVVGVVGDANFGPRDEPDVDEFYAPAAQPALFPPPGASGRLSNPSGGCILVRSALPPEQLTQTVRSAIAEIDPLLLCSKCSPWMP